MTRRTTVAVVAPRYTELGGMQNYARRVAGWLRDDEDFDVVVISTKPGLRRDETTLDGVRVIRLGTWLTLSNTPVNPLWFWQLRRLFRRLGVDVVNAHSPVPFLADLAVLAAGRRPSVLTYHAGSLVKGSGGVVDAVLRGYEQMVLPRVFRRATRHVAVSPVASNLNTGRAVTITPGVDTGVFVPASTPRRRSVVFTGRVERTSAWKGVPVLLDAFARVARDVPDAVLDVVGDGDAVPDMQQRAADLGIGDRIRWHGALDASGVAGVLADAGVAVLPSLTESESFGMTLIEAMAAGCPVVGSDVGGIPHVIRDDVDGLLVPPGDVAALASAIGRVLTDDALAQRLGTAGRQAAEDVWDWRRQRVRTLEQLRLPDITGPKRIAVVTDSVSPWNTGGKEQRQHELYTRLADRGHHIDVYTMKWWHDETSQPRVRRDGITFHAISPYVPLYTKGRRSILQAAVFALSSLRMITRRYDVLEVDSIPFLPVFPSRIVAWLRRTPMTVTSHEYWGTQYWTTYLGALGPLGRLAGLVERTAVRLPDRVLAASDGTAERLRDEGVRDVRVVTPGISADVFDAPRGARAPRPRLRLVCAGRLLDHKNVDVAIRCVDVLARRGIDTRLEVIGQGPAADDLLLLAKQLGLDDRVDFLAFLPEHRDLLAKVAAADLLLFPTVREGFGMVALEAMAVGTPVITSDHPDNFARHLVRPGVNGTVCSPTPEAFADAVESCRERLGLLSAGARETALGYDWDRIADAAENAYRDL